MRTPRLPEARAGRVALPAIIALVATVVAVGFGVSGSHERSVGSEASSWRGLVGGARPSVTVGQRMLVVLKKPSLAQRVWEHGGLATERQERAWTKAAIAGQKQLLTELAIHGIRMRPEFSFARVLNGFSAPLDARAVALLERRPEVAGVYPVRVAYPASISSDLADRKGLALEAGHVRSVKLPGYTGRGVTIALLDTGVNRLHPYLRGRMEDGIDVLGDYSGAPAAADPDDPSRLERHGTELAGILVGAGGPGRISGVATGASVLPIRVAGWQRDLTGSWAVYGRTDQIVAGLERAVDPNLDGDAHDAVRIALIGLAASYGAFADSPEARAIRGALRLDTLVVAPAGNDGPAGPGYGSVSSPGGAPEALTVGAADLRHQAEEVPVMLRAGLQIFLNRPLPLAGALVSSHQRELELVAPRSTESGSATSELDDFFDGRGRSLVAGRAALVHAGDDPQLAIEYAASAGAAAVVLYGNAQLPAGGLGLDENVTVPVVSVPERAGRLALDALARHRRPAVSIGVPVAARNGSFGEIAPFSSRGLAFDGRVKPDLAAPGVGLATSEPGRNEDGSARFGTVNGTSPAAAVVAGAAAVLAQARPALSAPELKGVLTGTARPLREAGVASQGAGLLDLDAASVAELATDPGTLAFGRAQGDGWEATQELTLLNSSSRWLPVRVRAVGQGGLAIAATPERVYLRPGGTRKVLLRARLVGAPPTGGSAEGAILLIARGAGPLRVPWAITFGAPPHGLISAVALSSTSFKPSDTTPAVLSLRAGSLLQEPIGPQVQPVARLDVELWRGKRRLGLLARLRDLLPGRVAIGLTGRNPEGGLLRRGKFRIRLLAVPTSEGPKTRQTIDFTIK
jgi:minor extracellular serine protease Vpr